MDFSWTRTQKEFRDAAVRFAAKELNGGVSEREKQNEFPRQEWKKCASFGIQGLPVPSRYGGSGQDILSIVCVLEGLGYGCRDNGFLFSLCAHMCGCEIPLVCFGSREQKNTYLPGLCSGSSIGAFAVTEPGSGSDVFSMKTSARREKAQYVLDGTKSFVTNAPVADIFIVCARTGKTHTMRDFSCFIVRKGMPGVHIGKNVDKMGLRTSPMAEIVFDGCRIPSANLIGKEGMGAVIFNNTMEWERIVCMAAVTGGMERQLESCVRYSGQREQFGSRIGRFQSISNMIADMKARLEAGRLLLYKAAWLKKNGRQAYLDAALAKLSVSESFVQNSLNAVHIHGGYGYTTEQGLERELRDAVAATLYSGTSELQRNSIAALMGL